MDVNQSNILVDRVGFLRENIYNQDNFKEVFTKELEKELDASNIKFIPDELGGYNVNLKLGDSKALQPKTHFDVCDALINTCNFFINDGTLDDYPFRMLFDIKDAGDHYIQINI